MVGTYSPSFYNSIDQKLKNDEILFFRLNVSVLLENGGFLDYENRDNRKTYNATGKWPKQPRVYLKGIQTRESYIFHWDIVLPYYDCSKSLSCPSLPVYVPDTSTSVSINFVGRTNA